MTLEAAVVLPVFLILFMNLFSAMEQYRIHSNIMYSLWQKGRMAMQYAYLENRLSEVEEELDWSEIFSKGSSTISWIQVRRKIIDNLDQYKMWRQLILFQDKGLLLDISNQSDIICYRCTYSIHPLFSAYTNSNNRVTAQFYGHAFTGYSLRPITENTESEKEEEYVFVTKTGTSYHENRGCSYLNPSIHLVAAADMDEQRNESGGKYYPCSLCATEQGVALYYVTDYGTSYHCSTACSGLKRTIYEIKRSETGGRTACSKCSRG